MKLRLALRAEDIDVWWDDDLYASQKWEETIDKSLTEASAIIVLWSETSIASDWVRYEASAAKSRGTLVPAKVSRCDIPTPFLSVQTVDLLHWDGHEEARPFQQIVKSIRNLDRPRSITVNGESEIEKLTSIIHQLEGKNKKMAAAGDKLLEAVNKALMLWRSAFGISVVLVLILAFGNKI